MPISITCACGKQLRAPDSAAGKRMKCPGCQQFLVVTAANPPAMPLESVKKGNTAIPASTSSVEPGQPSRRWPWIVAVSLLVLVGGFAIGGTLVLLQRRNAGEQLPNLMLTSTETQPGRNDKSPGGSTAVEPNSGRVGLTVTTVGDQQIVSSVVLGYPAATVGNIRLGDRLVSIGQTADQLQPAQDWSPEEITKALRGEPGSPVWVAVTARGAAEPTVRKLTRVPSDPTLKTNRLTWTKSGHQLVIPNSLIEQFPNSTRKYEFPINESEIAAFPEKLAGKRIAVVTELTFPQVTPQQIRLRLFSQGDGLMGVILRSQYPDFFEAIVSNDPKTNDHVIVHARLVHYSDSAQLYGEIEEIMFLNPERPDAYKPFMIAAQPVVKEPMPEPPPKPVEIPKAALQLVEQGVAAYGKQDVDSAIGKFTDAIKLFAEYGLAYRHRGQCYLRKGDLKTAEADLTKAIELLPEDPLAYRFRAEVSLGNQRFIDAIVDCDKALRLKPDDLLAHDLRGNAHRRNQSYENAVDDFTAVIRLDPKNLAAYQKRADAYRLLAQAQTRYNRVESKRSAEKAVLDASEVLRVMPQDVTALETRSLAYYAYGDFEKAMADCTAILAIDSKRWMPYQVRGLSFLERRDFPRAIADFTQAIALNGKDQMSWRGRGIANVNLRNDKQALEDLTQAIDLAAAAKATDTTAHYWRGRLYNLNKNYEAAIADLTAVIRADNKNAKAYYERSRANYALKRVVPGKTDFDKAVKLDPNVAKE